MLYTIAKASVSFYLPVVKKTIFKGNIMRMKSKDLLIITLLLSALNGCSSGPSKQRGDVVTDNNSLEINNDSCEDIDPINTSLITSGVVGLVTLNPVITLVIGGGTYLIINSGAFDCN